MTFEELQKIYNKHREELDSFEKIIALDFVSNDIDWEVFYANKVKAYKESSEFFKKIAMELNDEGNPIWREVDGWAIEDFFSSRKALVYQEAEEELKKPEDERYLERFSASRKLAGKKQPIVFIKENECIPYGERVPRDFCSRPSRLVTALKLEEEKKKAEAKSQKNKEKNFRKKENRKNKKNEVEETALLEKVLENPVKNEGPPVLQEENQSQVKEQTLVLTLEQKLKFYNDAFDEANALFNDPESKIKEHLDEEAVRTYIFQVETYKKYLNQAAAIGYNKIRYILANLIKFNFSVLAGACITRGDSVTALDLYRKLMIIHDFQPQAFFSGVEISIVCVALYQIADICHSLEGCDEERVDAYKRIVELSRVDNFEMIIADVSMSNVDRNKAKEMINIAKIELGILKKPAEKATLLIEKYKDLHEKITQYFREIKEGISAENLPRITSGYAAYLKEYLAAMQDIKEGENNLGASNFIVKLMITYLSKIASTGLMIQPEKEIRAIVIYDKIIEINDSHSLSLSKSDPEFLYTLLNAYYNLAHLSVVACQDNRKAKQCYEIIINASKDESIGNAILGHAGIMQLVNNSRMALERYTKYLVNVSLGQNPITTFGASVNENSSRKMDQKSNKI